MLASPPAGTGPNGELTESETLAAESANSNRTNFLGLWISPSDLASFRRQPDGKNAGHSDAEEEGCGEAFTETELKTIFDPASFGKAKLPTQFWPALFALYIGSSSKELTINVESKSKPRARASRQGP